MKYNNRYNDLEKNVNITYKNGSWGYTIISIFTAIIGHEIHGSIFWSIVNFIFWPFAWLKWLICQEVNMSIIKSAFDFFLQ